MSEAEDLVLLEWSGYRYIMPVEDALTVFKIMRGVPRLDSSYIDSVWTYYIKRDNTTFSVKQLDKNHYTEALINGERP